MKTGKQVVEMVRELYSTYKNTAKRLTSIKVNDYERSFLAEHRLKRSSVGSFELNYPVEMIEPFVVRDVQEVTITLKAKGRFDSDKIIKCVRVYLKEDSHYWLDFFTARIDSGAADLKKGEFIALGGYFDVAFNSEYVWFKENQPLSLSFVSLDSDI